jgi:tight adherence protein C
MYEAYALPASVFASVACTAWWLVRIFSGRDEEKLRDRLRVNGKSEEPTGGGLLATAASKWSWGAVLGEMGQKAGRAFMPNSREKLSKLRKQLGYAGMYSPSAVRMVQGAKLIFGGGGLALGYVFGLVIGYVALGVSLGGLVGYLVPMLWVKSRISRNRRALERALPDALDLMVVCVEAGLTLDAAMQRVGQELGMAHPELARELEMVHLETRIGVQRSDALKNMGTRTGIATVQLVASVLRQSERFGTSVAQSLRVQAETLRVNRQYAAEEQAAKASVKLSFPVVLFIFPAVLIVLAGPAAIGLFKSALFNN